MTLRPATYTKEDAPTLAQRLGNEEFQYLLIAFKLADKHGRFDARAVGQETGRYWRDVQDTEWYLRGIQILGDNGFTEIGRAVGKEVRRMSAERRGLSDPDAKPGLLRRLLRTFADDFHKIAIDIIKAIAIPAALAGLYLLFKRHGLDLHLWTR